MSTGDLKDKMLDTFKGYEPIRHLTSLEALTQLSIDESQIAQIIGKSRLYNYLPKSEKVTMPEFLLNDGQINMVAKDYYNDKCFSRDEAGEISLWKFYNLLTGSNKSSYIDTFLDRGVNAFEFSNGISKDLRDRNSSYSWFLN